jgi:hypothetical protein
MRSLRVIVRAAETAAPSVTQAECSLKQRDEIDAECSLDLIFIGVSIRWYCGSTSASSDTGDAIFVGRQKRPQDLSDEGGDVLRRYCQRDKSGRRRLIKPRNKQFRRR